MKGQTNLHVVSDSRRDITAANHRVTMADSGQKLRSGIGVQLRRVADSFERMMVFLRFKLNRYTFGLSDRIGFGRFALILLVAVGLLCWKVEIVSTDRWTDDASEASFVSGTLSSDGDENHSYDWRDILNGQTTNLSPRAKTSNSLAPASVSELNEKMIVDYIERFGKVAVTEMDKFGIPASISLAQGLIESRCGTSILAQKNNNHFGMKCFSKKCAKGHCSNHTDDHHKDFFRIYKSAWESWRAHSQMLMGGRYKVLRKHGKDYRKWAKGLRDLGYATDKNYDKKLVNIIERFNLHQFDDL